MTENSITIDEQDIELFNSVFSKENLENTFKNKKSIYSKQSSGIDRKSIENFEKETKNIFPKILEKIKGSDYYFSPYVESLFLRGPDKQPRRISLPTIRDKLTLDLVRQYLNKKLGQSVKRTLPNIYIKEIKKFFEDKDTKSLKYKRIDISSFYKSINHIILLNFLRNIKVHDSVYTLIRRAIKTNTYNKSVYLRKDKENNNKGLPEGLSISNVLAEYYLREIGLIPIPQGVLYQRYVDDILILYQDEHAFQSFYNKIERKFKKLDLNISKDEDKTGEGNLSSDKGFNFLGYDFKKGKIYAKRRSQVKLINTIIKLFTQYKYSTQKNELKNRILIEDVNEKLTGAMSESIKYGWIFFFREITDINFLYQVDILVEKLLDRYKLSVSSEVKKIKQISKAYYKLKKNDYSYCHNYDAYSTFSDKINYLSGRVKESREDLKTKTFEYIDSLFKEVRNRNLSNLEKDNGVESY
ncbi:MAG: hypothetical protein HRT47_01790 [Candidatus Caenarcaniphilales bacterium]|nr:hypothetical protein [Candidatus Caenarcaniphilales bacterium]